MNNLCCPPKSKKSLDYIMRWIDSADIVLNQLSASVMKLQNWKDSIDSDINELVEEAISNYDWSQVSEFETLQGQIDSLNTSLNEKVSKTIPSSAGNIPSLDALGNLLDSGINVSTISSINGKADKDIDAVVNNLAKFDSSGNPVDSGYAISDFAPASHSHNSIISTNAQVEVMNTGDVNISGSNAINIVIDLMQPPSTWGEITKGIGDHPVPVTHNEATINFNNINNLNRALADPDIVPTADSDNLVTSGGVKAALDAKMDELDEIVLSQSMSAWYIDQSSASRDNAAALFNSLESGIPKLVKIRLDTEFNSNEEHVFCTIGSIEQTYDTIDGGQGAEERKGTTVRVYVDGVVLYMFLEDIHLGGIDGSEFQGTAFTKSSWTF